MQHTVLLRLDLTVEEPDEVAGRTDADWRQLVQNACENSPAREALAATVQADVSLRVAGLDDLMTLLPKFELGDRLKLQQLLTEASGD